MPISRSASSGSIPGVAWTAAQLSTIERCSCRQQAAESLVFLGFADRLAGLALREQVAVALVAEADYLEPAVLFTVVVMLARCPQSTCEFGERQRLREPHRAVTHVTLVVSQAGGFLRRSQDLPEILVGDGPAAVADHYTRAAVLELPQEDVALIDAQAEQVDSRVYDHLQTSGAGWLTR